MSKIARERVELLYDEAEKVYRGDPGMGRKYVLQAQKIAQRNNIRVPRQLKRKTCKCGALLIPGFNCSVRIRNGKKNVKCNECGAIKRIVLR